MRFFIRGALLLALAASCFGASITFVHTGTGSGTIGAISFTNAAFTITEIADTANRQMQAAGTFFIDDTSASIDIAGVGVFSFITGTRTFVNNSSQIVGFSRSGSSGLDLYNGPTSAAFATYDLLSSIGPIGGVAHLIQWGNTPVNTSGGVLFFENSDAQGTFTATVAGVPEPSTVALLGAGIVALAALRRRIAR